MVPNEEAEVGGHVEVGRVVGEAVVDESVGQPVEGDQQEVTPRRRVEPHHLDYPEAGVLIRKLSQLTPLS